MEQIMHTEQIEEQLEAARNAFFLLFLHKDSAMEVLQGLGMADQVSPLSIVLRLRKGTMGRPLWTIGIRLLASFDERGWVHM